MEFVATDLDGTIVHPDGTVSPATVEALRACERAGVPVAIVTGRPPRWLPDAVTATGLDGVAICANGAVVYDWDTRRILQAWTIPLDVVRETVETLRGVLTQVRVAVETTHGYRREPGYHATFTDDDEPPRAQLEQILAGDLGDGIVKVLIRADGRGDQLWQVAQQHVGHLVQPTHSNSHDNLLELGPVGVSKAVTLARFVAEHGVAAPGVIAFGDQPNDIEMLRWAGVGVAMADGHPEAIAAADLVAPPLSQDGVAQVLRARLRESG
ncbi:MAG: HAD family hydrolase [Actinomycetales bacterium]